MLLLLGALLLAPRALADTIRTDGDKAMGHIVAIKGDSLTFLEACNQQAVPREIKWVDINFDHQCKLDEPDILESSDLYIPGESDVDMHIARAVDPDEPDGTRKVLILDGNADDFNRLKEAKQIVISSDDGPQAVLKLDSQQTQALMKPTGISDLKKGAQVRASMMLNDQQVRVLEGLNKQQRLERWTISCAPNSESFVMQRIESYAGHSFNLWVRPSESPVQFYPTQDAAETQCPRKQYTPTFRTSFCNKTILIADDVELLGDDLLRMKLPDGSQHVEPRRHVTQLRKVFRCLAASPSQAVPPGK